MIHGMNILKQFYMTNLKGLWLFTLINTTHMRL